jgi:hypothetical protein
MNGKNRACEIFIKLLRNRRGTAEIVGSVLFLVILLFFFTNVYLWHDQATRRMDDVVADKINSIIEVTYNGTDKTMMVTNKGGVGVALSRLWINNDDSHIYFDLENIQGGGVPWVSGGTTLEIRFNSSAPEPVGWDGQSLVVEYEPVADDVFKVLSALGNIGACEYKLDT